MNTTRDSKTRQPKSNRDPLATLRARGLVTPPRSKERDTSMPTIKPKDGGCVSDLVEEWR
ncbi:MAG TPA: hypothetical protein VHF90_01610 [Thermoleophilaceae bacterium]|nr:hypothetical protein [Thermoleophilaceae bacterium]